MWRRSMVPVVLTAACGRIGFDTGSTLDIDFTRQLGGAVLARPSVATYVDAQGIVRPALANEPRFDHDPVTFEPLGLLIEDTRTNLLDHSEQLDNSSWFTNGVIVVTADQAVAPDGTMTADEVDDQDITNNARFANGPVVQDDTLPYTYSVFVRAGTVSRCGFSAELIGGTTWIQIGLNLDLATGTFLGGIPAAPHGIQPYPGGWFRVWLTITNNGTGNTSALLSVWGDRLIPTTMGSFYAWGGQIEQSDHPTSYIPTIDVTTRLADVVTTSDLGWLDRERGTLRVTARVAAETNVTHPAACLIGLDRLCLGRSTAGATELSLGQQNVVGTPWPSLERRTAIAAWSTGEATLYDDGGVVGGQETIPNAFTTAGFGTDLTNVLEGHLARVTYWPERMVDSELPALATP